MSWFLDKKPSKKEMTHSYVNYKSSHTSHRYESKTAQIVQFPGMPTVTDYDHSSPRKDFSSKPFLMPWGSVRDQPERVDGLSPKFHQEVVHGKDTGSPRKDSYKGNSPRGRDHELGKFSSFRNKDDDTNTEDDEDDDYDYVCNEDEVCVKNYKKPVSKPNHLINEGYVRNNDKYRANGYETNYEQTKPRRQTYYDKSYDDLDLEKEKGKFNAPKYTSNNYSFPSSNHPKPDTYYEKNPSYYTEKDHGNSKSHVAPSYTIPSPNQPKREQYYGTSYTDNTTEKEREKSHAGYIHSAPPSNQPKKDAYYDKAPTYYNDKRHENRCIPPYTVPVTTIPRKEQKYERSNSGPMMMTNPPPIRTRVPPRKDHQGYGDTINDVEAHWRYGKGQPRVESYVEETYSGVIDAREAARRYNGVMLTD